MIYGRKLFDHPVKNDLRTYGNILKITIGQGDDYATGCLLYYPYLQKYYKMITLGLSKLQVLGADLNAIQQIDFTRYLDKDGNKTKFSFVEGTKENILDFLQGTMRVL